MLDLTRENNRRIYERTLTMVLLVAAEKLYPGSSVRMEYSAGSGVFIRISGQFFRGDDLLNLEAEMRRIIESNLPIMAEEWNTEDAIRYFEAHHRPDKAELMRVLREGKRICRNTIRLYRCDDYLDDLGGEMAASTGEVPVFTLMGNFPGFILQLPGAAHFGRPAPFFCRPKHLNAFAQSDLWCKRMQVTNAADLARLSREGKMREFIRMNELLQEDAISDIAKEIVARERRIVLIAGPSSSGKTTFAKRLGTHLRVLGRHYLRVSMDDYYYNRDDCPIGLDGKPDLETVEALDIPLLKSQLSDLIDGKSVPVPRFDFVTGKRCPEGVQTQLKNNEIIIVEGIHGLNPMLTDGLVPPVHRIFISALTCMNVDEHNRIHTTDIRLLRRIVRDSRTRGTAPEGTIAMWDSVRAGEEKWIFAYQEMADSVFNSTLHYEIPVLKRYVFEAMEKASQFPIAVRIAEMLRNIPDFDRELENEIPPMSLLREFIGGGTAEL